MEKFSVARCNAYMGHCDLCIEEMGGCPTGKKHMEEKEKENNDYHFDPKRPVSSTIEAMMGMSIWEYCGL